MGILLVAVLAASIVVAQQLVHAKGLKVFLTVNTNVGSQPANIETYQHGNKVYSHGWSIGAGTTTLEYPDDLIETGSYEICITAQYDNLRSCGTGYNSEANKPEYVSVSLFGSTQPPQQLQQQGPSQSQSQSSNNENNNALSQSQETTIIICNDGKCKPQQ
jgi:hypothetical protein